MIKRDYIKYWAEVNKIEESLNILDARNPIEASEIINLQARLGVILNEIKNYKPKLELINSKEGVGE